MRAKKSKTTTRTRPTRLDDALSRLAVLEHAIMRLPTSDTTFRDGLRFIVADICEDIAAARLSTGGGV